MCLLPIHVHLIEYVEIIQPKFSTREKPLVIRRSWSLPTKLIAGKRNYVKAIGGVLIVQLPEARIVDVLQRS